MFQLTWKEMEFLKITICDFKITNCDLEKGQEYQVSSLCFYRAGGGHAFECLKKPAGRARQYRDYADVRLIEGVAFNAQRIGLSIQGT